MNHKQFAINLAKESGKIILKNFQFGMKREKKFDMSPVTKSDLAIDKLFRTQSKKYYPNYGIISEEGENYLIDAEYVWLCDPLDGTIPYTRGIPTSTFMLALLKNGKSILGVVYDPYLDRLFYAEKGKGAYLNNEPIHVSKTADFPQTAIGVCNWKRSGIDLNKFRQSLVELQAYDLSLMSVGYMDMLVAVGEFAGVIFPGKAPWDSAAPKIIIEEAGGKLTDLDGKEPIFTKQVKGHLASNGIMHKKLLKLI